MTLTEVVTLFRMYVQDADGDRWTWADACGFINVAQQQLAQMILEADEWYWAKPKTYAVVATVDAREFALPTDLVKVLGVERQTGTNPIQADWTSFSERHFYFRNDIEVSAGISRPRCYIRRDKLGVVAPTDSYTLTMWYSYRLPDLSLTSDVSDIPFEHHTLLALYAAKLALASEERSFDNFEKEFEGQLERLMTSVEERQRQKPRYVKYVPE